MVLACSFGLYRELQAPAPLAEPSSVALPVPTSTPEAASTPQATRTKDQKPRMQSLAVRNVEKPPPLEPQVPAAAVQQPRLPHSSYPQRRELPGIAEQIASGLILASFQGTGRDGGMVFAQLYNPGRGPLRIHLKPGMILQPPIGHEVQPLLLEDEVQVTLKPGESYSAPLNSYCMDSQVPAPGQGEVVDYKFVPPNGRDAAVAVLKTAQRMDFPNRRAVIQIAIWKSLGQPVHQFHFVSVLGASAHNPAVKARVLRDVEQLLEAAKH